MNLIDTVDKGIAGRSMGLNCGMPKLNRLIGGFQKYQSFAWGAEKKVGKTSYVDKLTIINPYLNNPNIKKQWIYYATEMDRISKEAKFTAFFLYHDFKIDVSDNYILGREIDDNNERKIVTKEHREKIITIYQNRIVPLFGEYDNRGKIVSKGMIDYIEQRENPTGIRNYLMTWAKNNGEFIYEFYNVVEQGKQVQKKRIIGWNPNDPNLYLQVIIDHIRGLSKERGFTLKQNMDKMSEYHVDLRNWTGMIFHFVCHLNRGLNDVDRLKFMKDKIYPTSEDFKDSGNLAEDCTNIITLMNPADDKYNLNTHFGKSFKQYKGNYRTIHLVDARYAPAPQHIGTLFDGKNIRIKEI